MGGKHVQRGVERLRRIPRALIVNSAVFGGGATVAAVAVGLSLVAAARDTREQPLGEGADSAAVATAIGRSGPIRTTDDIDPELQKVLKMAAAPTHDQPTPWGNFVINPVINGAGILNPQHSAIPLLNGPAAKTVEIAGPQAPTLVGASIRRFIDVPPTFQKGMPALGAVGSEEGERFWTRVDYGSGDGTSNYQSVSVEAFTPTEPVVFDEFPDNAIRHFAASLVVRGNPTLTVLPDKITADPRMERVVAWSQGSAVYFVRTTGLFTDDEVLELAQQVAAGAEAKP
jgi:hypothetical protein